MPQMPGQQRGGGRAINVIVAEDGHLLAAHRGVRQALRRGFHLRHAGGVGHQFADGRIEKILDRIQRNVASGDHARQHLRQRKLLHHGLRPRGGAGIKPAAPQLAGRGSRDTEKRGRSFRGQCGRDGHDAFPRCARTARPINRKTTISAGLGGNNSAIMKWRRLYKALIRLMKDASPAKTFIFRKAKHWHGICEFGRCVRPSFQQQEKCPPCLTSLAPTRSRASPCATAR